MVQSIAEHGLVYLLDTNGLLLKAIAKGWMGGLSSRVYCILFYIEIKVNFETKIFKLHT